MFLFSNYCHSLLVLTILVACSSFNTNLRCRQFTAISRSRIQATADQDEQAREDVRSRLIEACAQYKKAQVESWSASASAEEPGTENKTKILDDCRSNVLASIANLSALNPTPRPFAEWKSNSTAVAELFDGPWELRFTDAPDATFKPGKRGPATTSQSINSSTVLFAGVITNIINFKENKGKVKAVYVIINAQEEDENGAIHDEEKRNRLYLQFKRVIIDRQRSRLKILNFPFPSLSWITRPIKWIKNKFRKEKPVSPSVSYLALLYLDEEVRVHRTGRGYYFVQARLYDVWDPSIGWTQISMV